MHQLLIYIVLLFLIQLQYAPDTTDLQPLIKEGALIYNEGRILSDREAQATYLNQVVALHTVACVTCHGPNGEGSKDPSGIVIPPINKDALRAKLESQYAQKTINDKLYKRSLSKAVTIGEGMDGRALHVLMPRYELTLQEMSSLLIYLDTIKEKE